MKTLFQSARRYATWKRWQFLYIVLSLSWLLAPGNNPGLSAHTTFISEYEDPGRPWSWLYLSCDISAALLLGLAVVVIARKWRRFDYSLLLLAVVAAGSFIDATFPSNCHGGGLLCMIPNGLLSTVHAAESTVTTVALLLVNLLWALKKAAWARAVLFVQAAWVIIFLVNRVTGHAGNTFAQFAYEIVVVLWVAQLVSLLASAGRKQPTEIKGGSLLVHVITGWIFLGGFLTIVNSLRSVREISHLSAAYFGNNTAWLSQHGVIVGIVLLYVSRHLWRGEYRAWQLASALLWLETLKYAVLSPNVTLVLLYGLTAAVLFVRGDAFDRMTSTELLRERLKQLAWVFGAVLIALIIGVVAFRLKHHQDLDNLRINPFHFAKHLFLIDVVNDLGPLPRRLLGQVLNVAGLTLLFAILVSLFKPQKPLLKPDNEYERRHLQRLLAAGSNSSEDFFKYWPQPKSYWHDANDRTMIAYKVIGNVAFALADPVALTDGDRARAVQEFLTYCRSHGWLTCFVMVGESSRNFYKQAGCKMLRIGASAQVDVAAFATETSRNKWWRWVLNKARKQGWSYELAQPPHSPALLAQLRRVSDEWLQRQHHVERGFALGYFDQAYLQQCRLHLLRSDDGELIAFANEVPVYNNLPTATIDLMRFLPDRAHAMPALLAHTIQHLHEDGSKQVFDLGFVPLASPTARAEQLVRQFGQFLLSEAVSAQGLEQFKNKFEPAWADNYIAFDGDWIDLVHVSRQLDKLLQL
jgi:phosphatidylglycerol lysyltransferase